MNLICPCCKESPRLEADGCKCRYICACGSFTPWRKTREESDKDWVEAVEEWNAYEIWRMWKIVYYSVGC